MPAVKILFALLLIVVYATLSHSALAAQDMHSVWRQLALFMLLASATGITCWPLAALLKKNKIGVAATRAGLILYGMLMAYTAFIFWAQLLTRLDWIYFIEHAVTNGMLCWLFAHTLFGERTALITTLARQIHADLPDTVVRYTRTVTIAWAVFFAMQIAISIFIFNVGTIEAWSIFANILNWPLVAAMFVIEYAFRRRVDRQFPHATIRQSVAAYFNNKSNISH